MRETVCRLCLFETPMTFPLLDNNASEMLEKLTSIKVDPSDEIVSMCLKCNLNLKLAYHIQQGFLRTENKIKKGLLCITSIKIEENPVKAECHDSFKQSKSVCAICGMVFDENSVTTHVREHFSEQYCDLCNQNFCNIKSYRSHLHKHPDYVHYKCEKCDKKFLYKSLFDIHVESVHLMPKKISVEHNDFSETKQLQKIVPEETENKICMYTCDICQKQFSDNNKFRSHKQSHRRKECPICKKMISAVNLSKHIETHKSKPQVCEHCGKTCMSSEKLRGHIFYKHRGKKYECTECKVTYTSRQSLASHRKRNHNDGSGLICETCGRKFLLSYGLKRHIELTHMKLRPYVCEFCNKGFSGLNAMKTHRRQHTNETPYKCEVCGEGFRQKVSLKAHQRSKHDIVEDKTSKCEICGKGFSSLHAVKAHMRCH